MGNLILKTATAYRDNGKFNTYEALRLDDETVMRECFKKLAEIDDDFNGNNGEEYLWEVARKQGFSSNLNYAMAKAFEGCKSRNISVLRQEKVIKEFLSIWLDNDSYYREYKWNNDEFDSKYIINLAVILA